MTKPINIDAIVKETGKSWEEWLKFFDSISARDLSHAEIAREVHRSGMAGDWWAQSVTVAYEQHIGRRQPGQRSNGKFEVSVSMTFGGNRTEALKAWVKAVESKTEFNGVKVSRAGESSQKENFDYWHCGLEDGSRISVSMYEKAPGKVSIGLGHTGLGTAEDVEKWRTYWKSLMSEVGK